MNAHFQSLDLVELKMKSKKAFGFDLRVFPIFYGDPFMISRFHDFIQFNQAQMFLSLLFPQHAVGKRWSIEVS